MYSQKNPTYPQKGTGTLYIEIDILYIERDRALYIRKRTLHITQNAGCARVLYRRKGNCTSDYMRDM